MRPLILLIWCFTLFPAEAYAWGNDGHRIVCAVAWDEMRPTTRDHVQQLLGIEGREGFADTCTWADEYRMHGHRNTAGWHFLNVPPNALKVDMRRDCSGKGSCVVAQIEKDEDVLRSNAPVEEKATALKFLAHFVGDVHQPLHISHAEDKGGNAIEGRFINRKANLHEVWDSLIIRNTRKPWQQIATELERRVTDKERRMWTTSGPLEWAQESLEIANEPATEYRDSRTPFSLGAAYQREESAVAFRRLSQAGTRLARLVSGALDR